MRFSVLDDKNDYGDDAIDSMTTLKRLLGLLKPHLLRLILIFLLTLIVTAISMLIPKLVGDLIDDSMQQFSLSQLNRISLMLFVLIVAIAILRFLSSYWMGSVGAIFLRQLRERLFDHILNLSLSFFQKRQSGELNARIMTNLEFIQQILTNSLFFGIQSIFTLLGAVVLLAYTNIQLTVVALLVCIPIAVLSMFYSRRIEQSALKVDDSLAGSSANVEEVINGISTVQSFGNEAKEYSRYQRLMKRLVSAQLRLIKQQSLYVSLLDFLGYSALIIVIWFGGQQVINGELSIGNLTASLMYMTMFAMSLEDISGLVSDMGELSGVSHRVFQILDEKPSVKDEGVLEISKSTSLNIAFTEMYFSYSTDNVNATISQFSLNIKEGDELAIVGPSGSGKTTLFKLLLRFYDPNSGKIELNGKSLNAYKLSSLREVFGLVSQDVFLFSGTVLENIRYGNPEANTQEVMAAINSIGAADFIDSLANGLDEQVGVGGSKLSGGQKQLLGITRVYLRNPRILLLDEATSSLDSESEERVQESLKQLKKNRTTITIAHRLSTVRDSKNIILLKSGKLIATGNHNHLLTQCDLYKKYWNWQSRGINTADSDTQKAKY